MDFFTNFGAVRLPSFLISYASDICAVHTVPVLALVKINIIDVHIVYLCIFVQYFFTSFVSRDSTFRSLFLVWQNVSSEEPSSASDLMKTVGKYLDVDSDMETSSRGSNDEFPSELDDIIIGDGETESLVDSEEPHSIDSPKEPSIEKKADDIDKVCTVLSEIFRPAVFRLGKFPDENFTCNFTYEKYFIYELFQFHI